MHTDASPGLKLSETEARKCRTGEIPRCYIFSTGCGREEHPAIVVHAAWLRRLKGHDGEITCQRFPECAVRNYWLFTEWSLSIHNQNHPTRPVFAWRFWFHCFSIFLLVFFFFFTKEVCDSTDAITDGFWVELFLGRFDFVYHCVFSNFAVG